MLRGREKSVDEKEMQCIGLYLAPDCRGKRCWVVGVVTSFVNVLPPFLDYMTRHDLPPPWKTSNVDQNSE